MTYGFTTKNEKDLILSYCVEAENGNNIIGSKYFESMIKIIKGFALNDSESMLSGIKSLNKQGYVHYSNWYKKKILDDFVKKWSKNIFLLHIRVENYLI